MNKSQYSYEPQEERRETQYKKHFQRLVEEVYSSDIHSSLRDMFSHIFEESGGACRCMCLDIDPFYGETFFIHLDERIDDI